MSATSKRGPGGSHWVKCHGVTADFVRAIFIYDAETGVFTRRVRTANSNQSGEVVGSPDVHGYLKVTLEGRRWLLHRLAWLYVNGEWPRDQIDHIDRNKQNNRIANLRDVSQTINQRNRTESRRDSSSGLLGAHKHLDGFKAAITVNGKSRHIGKFRTAEEAHAAYLIAKREFHGEVGQCRD